jgi:hypothetical protein
MAALSRLHSVCNIGKTQAGGNASDASPLSGGVSVAARDADAATIRGGRRLDH